MENEIDWKNGDLCSLYGFGSNWIYGCDVPDHSGWCIVFRGKEHMRVCKRLLSKPETTAQQILREHNEKKRSQIDGVVKDINSNMLWMDNEQAFDLAYMLQERGHLKAINHEK